MELKAKRICDEVGSGIPYVMILSYILDKGQSTIIQITDEDIENLEENGLMTKEFIQGLVKTAREVVLNCDQSDIIALAKAEWCCTGEHYDPGLGMFIPYNYEDEEE